MALTCRRWLPGVCVVVLALAWFETRGARAVIVNDLDPLEKDKKSWSDSDDQLTENGIQTAESDADKREWPLDRSDLDLALDEQAVKRKWGSNMKVWGKRGVDTTDDDDKRAWNNNLRVWGKREPQEEDKRQWNSGGLRVWGKREWPSKKWGNLNTMKVWGKRDQDPSSKRKWGNNMRVWGKRNGIDIDDMDKRKWGNAMKVWGKRSDMSDEEKRAWDNQFKVWGKRIPESMESVGDQKVTDGLNADKKAWNSNMRVWGKRSISKRSIESLNDDYKRNWNTGSMRVWGKRRNEEEGPKRNWNNNIMRVWGKRSLDDLNLDDETEKRKWGSNMRVWGKRNWDTNRIRTWGKRAWDNNSMLRTWGKRNSISPSELLETLNELYSKDGEYQR